MGTTRIDSISSFDAGQDNGDGCELAGDERKEVTYTFPVPATSDLTSAPAAGVTVLSNQHKTIAIRKRGKFVIATSFEHSELKGRSICYFTSLLHLAKPIPRPQPPR